MPEKKVLHVRIEDEISTVISALIQPNGLYPAYADRSAAFAVSQLIRKSPDFKQAQAQNASEKHPRPAGAKR